MLPSSPSADLSQYALLRLCFGRAVFCCPLFRRTGEHDCASPAVAPQGASRRRSKSLLKHRVQGAALPAMLPSSPSADYISVCTFTALLRQSRFLLPTFPENRGARLRISGGWRYPLLIIAKGGSFSTRINATALFFHKHSLWFSI